MLKKWTILVNPGRESVFITCYNNDVFNFEVEKYHTYVAEGIIVHNKGIEDPGGGGEGGIGNTGRSLYNCTRDDPTGP